MSASASASAPASASSAPAAGGASAAAAARLSPDVTKLELENQSLKRRLVQYAATLEKLTGHARREIDASVRARDEALAAAADAAALRDRLADAEAAVAAAMAARARAEEAVVGWERRARELEGETQSAQRGVGERGLPGSGGDGAEAQALKERVEVAEREAAKAKEEARREKDRADGVAHELEKVREETEATRRAVERLQEVEAARDAALGDKERAESAVREVSAREVSAREQRDAFEKQTTERDGIVQRLTAELAAATDGLSKAKAAASAAGAAGDAAASEARSRLVHAEETIAALRAELDEAMAQLADTKSALQDQVEAARELEKQREAADERDALKVNLSSMQDELEQSNELLTRAAIDALGDKQRIRKLEDSLSKLRHTLSAEREASLAKDQKIETLAHDLRVMERELDDLRNAKRTLAEECHKYQMQIHEQNNVMATKSRALKDLGAVRADREAQSQKLSLELSNSRNALAKKESEFINLSGEHSELHAQLKSTAKALEEKHMELSTMRREVTASKERVKDLLADAERTKGIIADLKAARQQVQELTERAAERDEELSNTKRWYASLKAETSDASREKKRLSDMLSEVSADLKAANQELDTLRSLRKQHESLEARIADISANSTRELDLMRRQQSEQAKSLAKNTVEQYQTKLENIQSAAREDIAASVTQQLRNDLMPHLMHVVDRKAKTIVHNLARHVESFAIDVDEPSTEPSDLSSSERGSRRDDRGSATFTSPRTSSQYANRGESIATRGVPQSATSGPNVQFKSRSAHTFGRAGDSEYHEASFESRDLNDDGDGEGAVGEAEYAGAENRGSRAHAEDRTGRGNNDGDDDVDETVDATEVNARDAQDAGVFDFLSRGGNEPSDGGDEMIEEDDVLVEEEEEYPADVDERVEAAAAAIAAGLGLAPGSVEIVFEPQDSGSEAELNDGSEDEEDGVVNEPALVEELSEDSAGQNLEGDKPPQDAEATIPTASEMEPTSHEQAPNFAARDDGDVIEQQMLSAGDDNRPTDDRAHRSLNVEDPAASGEAAEEEVVSDSPDAPTQCDTSTDAVHDLSEDLGDGRGVATEDARELSDDSDAAHDRGLGTVEELPEHDDVRGAVDSEKGEKAMDQDAPKQQAGSTMDRELSTETDERKETPGIASRVSAAVSNAMASIRGVGNSNVDDGGSDSSGSAEAVVDPPNADSQSGEAPPTVDEVDVDVESDGKDPTTALEPDLVAEESSEAGGAVRELNASAPSVAPTNLETFTGEQPPEHAEDLGAIERDTEVEAEGLQGTPDGDQDAPRESVSDVEAEDLLGNDAKIAQEPAEENTDVEEVTSNTAKPRSAMPSAVASAGAVTAGVAAAGVAAGAAVTAGVAASAVATAGIAAAAVTTAGAAAASMFPRNDATSGTDSEMKPDGDYVAEQEPLESELAEARAVEVEPIDGDYGDSESHGAELAGQASTELGVAESESGPDVAAPDFNDTVSAEVESREEPGGEEDVSGAGNDERDSVENESSENELASTPELVVSDRAIDPVGIDSIGDQEVPAEAIAEDPAGESSVEEAQAHVASTGEEDLCAREVSGPEQVGLGDEDMVASETPRDFSAQLEDETGGFGDASSDKSDPALGQDFEGSAPATTEDHDIPESGLAEEAVDTVDPVTEVHDSFSPAPSAEVAQREITELEPGEAELVDEYDPAIGAGNVVELSDEEPQRFLEQGSGALDPKTAEAEAIASEDAPPHDAGDLTGGEGTIDSAEDLVEGVTDDEGADGIHESPELIGEGVTQLEDIPAEGERTLPTQEAAVGAAAAIAGGADPVVTLTQVVETDVESAGADGDDTGTRGLLGAVSTVVPDAEGKGIASVITTVAEAGDDPLAAAAGLSSGGHAAAVASALGDNPIAEAAGLSSAANTVAVASALGDNPIAEATGLSSAANAAAMASVLGDNPLAGAAGRMSGKPLSSVADALTGSEPSEEVEASSSNPLSSLTSALTGNESSEKAEPKPSGMLSSLASAVTGNKSSQEGETTSSNPLSSVTSALTGNRTSPGDDEKSGNPLSSVASALSDNPITAAASALTSKLPGMAE